MAIHNLCLQPWLQRCKGLGMEGVEGGTTYLVSYYAMILDNR